MLCNVPSWISQKEFEYPLCEPADFSNRAGAAVANWKTAVTTTKFMIYQQIIALTKQQLSAHMWNFESDADAFSYTFALIMFLDGYQICTCKTASEWLL